MEVQNINTTTLAYMGDGVYEVYVRKHLIERGLMFSDSLHKEAINYVNAKSQSKVYKVLLNGFLTEDEISLSKRARNHKMKTMAKNQSPVDYKNATALEALIGYTYLRKDFKRLDEIIQKSFEILEEKDE